jgi:small conductance mechanosensitive channel
LVFSSLFSGALSATVLSVFWNVILAIALLLIGKKLINFLLRRIDVLAERAKFDTGIRKFLRSLSQVVCYAVLIYTIAALIGVPTASFVALLGSVGLTVGLALQGSLSNFASGVLLLLLHPFHVGDLIEGGGVSGTVDAVGLFYTTVVTLDNKVISVPNSTLSGASITNLSATPTRRIDLTVGVGYGDDVAKAKSLLTDLLKSRDAVIRKDEAIVYVDELGSSSVVLGLRCWVNTADYWSERWALNEAIKETLDKAGISIPYSQLDVHLDNK